MSKLCPKEAKKSFITGLTFTHELQHPPDWPQFTVFLTMFYNVIEEKTFFLINILLVFNQGTRRIDTKCASCMILPKI